MSMTGELYRVPAERLQELLANPGQIHDELYLDDEAGRQRRGERGLTVEKAWDGIRFLLVSLAKAARILWVDPLPWYAPPDDSALTGAVLHYGPVCYRSPQQVAEIARGLSGLTRQQLSEHYRPEKMMEESVYPQVWDRPDEDNFGYLWSHFEDLVEFYRTAAEHGDGMLYWLA